MKQSKITIKSKQHSKFNPIYKNQSEKLKNQPLQKKDSDRIARVATYAMGNFLEGTYEIHYNKGSFTFQHHEEKHRVLSIAIDYDNQMAYKMGVYRKIAKYRFYYDDRYDFNDMVIIFIELSKYDPFARDAIREYLNKHFMATYCDPRNGFDKVSVLPQMEHAYDVVFLPKGPCREEYVFDEELYMKIKDPIEEAIDSQAKDYQFILNYLYND